MDYKSKLQAKKRRDVDFPRSEINNDDFVLRFTP